MLLALDEQGGGRFVSVHVTDFASVRSLVGWRRAARRAFPSVSGLVFGKALTSIGSKRSFGFGAGLPGVRRQVTLCAWRDAAAFDGFVAGGSLGRDARYDWAVLCEVLSTRGSHFGSRPLAAADGGPRSGPMAVLTLGRTSPRTLVPFLWRGGRLAEPIRSARGVISAVSAGIPLTGNATFSLWESADDMTAFAYAGGHLETVRVRPPILVEQLSARMRPLRVAGTWDPRSTLNPDRLAALI